MGQEINQKSHDSAIFNITALLTKEHHTLLRYNESSRREGKPPPERKNFTETKTEKTHKTETQI